MGIRHGGTHDADEPPLSPTCRHAEHDDSRGLTLSAWVLGPTLGGTHMYHDDEQR